MTRDVLVGVDAGTSVVKAVAFTRTGEQLAVAARPNRYRTGADGAAEQDMAWTWEETAGTLRDLLASEPEIGARVRALAVTGQGDGTWLIDAGGAPVGPAWLWLDSRAADETRAVRDGAHYGALYETTATGVAPCQQSSQLAWMAHHAPERLARAATSFHCKDWLYFKLTGERATDPSEGVFTYGDFRTRDYAETPLAQFGLEQHARLLPPIVDGAREAHPLGATAAAEIGLPAGLPVVLGYVDVICTALGGGLHDPGLHDFGSHDSGGGAGLSILGSTGVHMRYAAHARAVRLNPDRTGYTMCFPVPGAYAQMQSNLAATLNIDWLLDLMREVLAGSGVEKSRADLLPRIDALALAARAGGALYHPYISTAGERGPFLAPEARASFTGLDTRTGLAELTRAVLEGLAFAARDCYAAMGDVPAEVRLTGGAARSGAMRTILASVLGRPVRSLTREETGAAGAVMIAAVQQGLYPDMATCAAEWVTPYLGPVQRPDPALAEVYERRFPVYVRTRAALAPVWASLAAAAPDGRPGG